MPHYVLIGYDGPEGLERRKLQRERHLANLRPLDEARRIIHGGPILDPSGDPLGSVVIFEAPDLDSARDIAADDPYVVGGVFERYEVYETLVVFPAKP